MDRWQRWVSLDIWHCDPWNPAHPMTGNAIQHLSGVCERGLYGPRTPLIKMKSERETLAQISASPVRNVTIRDSPRARFPSRLTRSQRGGPAPGDWFPWLKRKCAADGSGRGPVPEARRHALHCSSVRSWPPTVTSMLMSNSLASEGTSAGGITRSITIRCASGRIARNGHFTLSRIFPSSLRHAGATLDAVNIARVEQLSTRPFHSDAGSD